MSFGSIFSHLISGAGDETADDLYIVQGAGKLLSYAGSHPAPAQWVKLDQPILLAFDRGHDVFHEVALSVVNDFLDV
ncbi:hypothetical protein D3C84_1133440 [compost metagenome]